jgi:hypothetical protein
MPGTIYTIWLSVAWTLVGVGVVLVIFGLFFNRSKGRARCRKCWQSLDGVPKTDKGWTCPECGTLARNPKQLHKTRKSWRLLLAGAGLLVLSHYAYYAPDVGRLGPHALLPTWALATLWPIDDLIDAQGYPITSPASEVLQDRLSHRTQPWATKLWLLRVRDRIEAAHAVELSHITGSLKTQVFDLTRPLGQLVGEEYGDLTDRPSYSVPVPPPKGPPFYPMRYIGERTFTNRTELMRSIGGEWPINPILEAIAKCESALEDDGGFQPVAYSLVGTQLVITCRDSHATVLAHVVQALRDSLTSAPRSMFMVELPGANFAVWNTRGLEGIYFFDSTSGLMTTWDEQVTHWDVRDSATIAEINEKVQAAKLIDHQQTP